MVDPDMDQVASSRTPPTASRFKTALLIITTTAAVLVNTIPLINEGHYILTYSRNVPILDTWGMIPAISTFVSHGHIWWDTIWAPDAEARPVMWRLYYLLSAKYTAFNVQIIKLTAIPFIALLLFIYAIIIRKTTNIRSVFNIALILLPVSILICSVSNWENLLEEWNVSNICSISIAITSSLIFSRSMRFDTNRNTWIYFFLGCIGCTIASLVGEPGLIAWPACLLLTVLPWSKKRWLRRIIFLLWTLAFYEVYTNNLILHHEAIGINVIPQLIQYYLAVLGNGVIGIIHNQPATSLATAIGISELVILFMLTFSIVKLKYINLEQLRYAFVPIIFGLAAAGLITIGRYSLGIQFATSSRYEFATSPTAVGIYLLIIAISTQVYTYHHIRIHTFWKNGRINCIRSVFMLTASVIVGLGLITGGIVGNVTEAPNQPYRLQYWTSLASIACNSPNISNSLLNEFQFNPPISTKYQLILNDIKLLKLDKLSLFHGNTCNNLKSITLPAP
ncbi:MAG: hypothetical protein ACP5OR_05890 [Candidatus Dormibacteria bacterium]